MKIPKLLSEKSFARKTPAEKRIAIAKDVIARIKVNNFSERRGHVIAGDVSWYYGMETPQTEINSNQCEVCARGALLCSWIGNFNKVEWNQIGNLVKGSGYFNADYSSKSFPAPLLEVFDRITLDNIEAAFEECTYDWHYNKNKTKQFAARFKGRNSIVELMEYIIQNGGEFPLPPAKKRIPSDRG